MQYGGQIVTNNASKEGARASVVVRKGSTVSVLNKKRSKTNKQTNNIYDAFTMRGSTQYGIY